MTTTIPDISESTILASVIAPEHPGMSPDVARELLSWEFTLQDRQRMTELAAKARAGTLSDSEQSVIEAYERVSSFLGLVKSKARRSLHHATTS
jgi:hypothetical protein